MRKVAREAGLSHGHLSKVERGEPGRPVTPKVLQAYERATAIALTGTAGHTSGAAPADGWRRGHLSEERRRVLRAKVAAVAAGGPLGEQVGRILDGTGWLTAPDPVRAVDVAQLEQVAALSAALDMRYGGGVADQLARAQLKWAIKLFDSTADPEVLRMVRAAVGCLAQRAGWAAFDADSHDVARSLFTVGLYAATDADDPDLRAHIITDVAAQANFLGYPDDCLYIVRHAEVDERVGPPVRMVIHVVKARAYGLVGDAAACHRQAELAAQALADTDGTRPEGWLTTVASSAQLRAGTGHALAALARRTDSATTRRHAQSQLAMAIDELDNRTQARAVALSMAQLTALYLEVGELAEGVRIGQRLLDAIGGIRSSRLTQHVAVVRRAAGAHLGEVAVKELAAELDAWLPATEGRA